MDKKLLLALKDTANGLKNQASIQFIATGTIKLIKELDYLNGCVQRGRGSDIDPEHPGRNIFEYIKELEAKAGVSVKPKAISPINGFGRIKIGASIGHDGRFFRWPECKPPQSEYLSGPYEYKATDPNMKFEVYWDGRHWDCRAIGYGSLAVKDGYGNGSIYVFKYEDVELI